MRVAVRLVLALLAAAVTSGHAQGPPDSARAAQPRLSVTLDRAADGAVRAPVVRAIAPLADVIAVPASAGDSRRGVNPLSRETTGSPSNGSHSR